MLRLLLLLVLVLWGAGAAWAQSGDPPASVPSAAERIFAAAPQRLLQIRTLVVGTDKQSSTGSGFLVSADGLAITNYHVVSQVALEPKTYRLEYTGADGSRGELKLLAIDLANDVAVVGLDRKDVPYFAFDDAAVARGLAKGERIYSMGNPLDLGFTIVEGTYNGLVERSYNERIHFTGALNAGMSGGPAVTGEGRVIGINVAKRLGGELMSFLVPARFAQTLLQGARDNGLEARADFRGEISRQLTEWQSRLYKSVIDSGFRSAAYGPYRAAEATVPWLNCAAQTNAGQTPRPRASLSSIGCRSNSALFIANDLVTGVFSLSHSYAKAVDLNQFQFATYLSLQTQPRRFWGLLRKWHTPQRCHEDYVITAPPSDRPPLRVSWCAQAYRAFSGLYDVSVVVATADRGSEALVSRLNLQAVSYEDAVLLGKRFLEAVQWTK